MLVAEHALEESEYNKSFLYTEVLIGIPNYVSTHFPHLDTLIQKIVIKINMNSVVKLVLIEQTMTVQLQ